MVVRPPAPALRPLYSLKSPSLMRSLVIVVIVVAFGPEPLPEPARKLVISNPQNEKKHMRFIKNKNFFDDTP